MSYLATHGASFPSLYNTSVRDRTCLLVHTSGRTTDQKQQCVVRPETRSSPCARPGSTPQGTGASRPGSASGLVEYWAWMSGVFNSVPWNSTYAYQVELGNAFSAFFQQAFKGM